MADLHNMTVAELAAGLKKKDFSAVEVATRFLARLGGNPHNAFLDINSEVTLAQARASDEKIAAGTAGPLEGVPIAHKDIFVTQDFATTAGSKMLQHYKSPFDATVVKNLRQAGMVTLGKLNCDEFAMGSANENSAYGAVTNPWNTAHIPGGSSGFASSLDQAGPMARSAEDCALLLTAMCGPDPDRDSTSLNLANDDFSRLLTMPAGDKPLATAGKEGGPLRIGVPENWLAIDQGSPLRQVDGCAPDVHMAIQNALRAYEQLGAALLPIALPHTQLSIPVYYIVCAAEASSNLSRFDGVKFGHRAKEFSDLADMYQRTRSEGFGDEVKRRIMIGSYVLSHGYYDAYYLQAQKIRRMIADGFQKAFAHCDLIAGPVAPTTAWKLGDKTDDPVANYLADIFTLPASLAGLPCMSIPVGFGEGSQMPVGMQLIGNYLQEAQLLNVAHRFQQVTDFHQAKPEGV